MTKHRIGIVGVGAIAGMHALAIRDLENAELVAFSNGTEPRMSDFQKEHGGQAFDTFQEMLDSGLCDVVTICTPSGAHLEPSVAALERGVHVLCEKPLEINLERAGKMIAAESASSATLGGIFPQRFSPVVQAVHAAAAGGRLGTLAAANAYVPWWRPDSYYGPNRWQGTKQLDGGGALINQSIHAIDTVLWLAAAAGAGAPVEAFGYSGMLCHDPQHIETEDCAAAAVRFESGAMGVVFGTTAMWPGGAMRFHLGGRDGTIELHEKELVTFAFRDERAEDKQLLERYGKAVGAGGAADPMAIDYSNHTRNLADFLAAIDEGRPSSVSAAEAWKALALIRAVYESAQSGQPVKVKPAPV
ncbi:Gfo/Idh/MocA family oxidoreductase [Botrimarina sp.]|uniref:Gfo/Idh/MocA family protein n=1 Tax=Botrimarina sp. TaxID=2795802 RepID=UPI0032EF1C90